VKEKISLIIGIIGILVAIYYGSQSTIKENKIGQINQKATKIINNNYFNYIPEELQLEIKDIQAVSGDSEVIR